METRVSGSHLLQGGCGGQPSQDPPSQRPLAQPPPSQNPPPPRDPPSQQPLSQPPPSQQLPSTHPLAKLAQGARASCALRCTSEVHGPGSRAKHIWWRDAASQATCGSHRTLPAGTQVGVVTLLGSLCPITLGHVQAFVEAQRLLLGHSEHHRPAQLGPFGAVLGLISLNGQEHVNSKLATKGEATLGQQARLGLVQLAVAELSWIGWEDREGDSLAALRMSWPRLHFVHFRINGADDVLRYSKYVTDADNRTITMGRHPHTTEVVVQANLRNINLEKGHFIMGPELPDISSSGARCALSDGDDGVAATLLHPQVLAWCQKHGPWRPAGS
jgi:hypothetical protein